MSIPSFGANEGPSLGQEQQLRRLQDDLNIIRGAADDGLPFAQTDIYFAGALSLSALLLALFVLLRQTSLGLFGLALAPSVFTLLAYLVYLARGSKTLRTKQPGRSRAYRGKLVAVLFTFVLCGAAIFRFDRHVPFIIVEAFLSLLGAALLLAAITGPAISLAQRFRRAQYLWGGLILLPASFVFPLFRQTDDQGNWAVALVGLAMLLAFVAIANMVYFLQLQKNRELVAPHGSD